MNSMNNLNKIRFKRIRNDEAGGIAGEVISIVIIILGLVLIGSLYLSAINNRSKELVDSIKSPAPTSTVSPTPGSTSPSDTGW